MLKPGDLDPGLTGLDELAELGDLIDVVLTGGPEDLPGTLSVPREMIADGKVKVRWHGGYEHYERPGNGTRERVGSTDGAEDPVFVWTMRTKIAE